MRVRVCVPMHKSTPDLLEEIARAAQLRTIHLCFFWKSGAVKRAKAKRVS